MRACRALRQPSVFALEALLAVPFVRARTIPWLIGPEVDQIPAGPMVGHVRRELERIHKSTGPILFGPWVSEVGFELLYWIPFLNWAVERYGLDRRRLVVLSRGGARLWYRHLTTDYVDVFDIFPLDEYVRANEEQWTKIGNQKQYDVTEMDHELIRRVGETHAIRGAQVLHPSLMYRLLRFYWFEKASVGLLSRHTRHRRFVPIDATPAVDGLPDDYVAIRFYFGESFTDTPENRSFAAKVVRSVAAHTPVVLLNTGLKLDDHEDLAVAAGRDIHRLDDVMTPEQNLEVQTRVISRARAFVGTYGGLSYLGPFYGVPSVGFYSNAVKLVPAHLDLSCRLRDSVGLATLSLDTRSLDVLLFFLEQARHDTAAGTGREADREPSTPRPTFS